MNESAIKPFSRSITLRTASGASVITIEPGQLTRLGELVRSHLRDADRALLVVDEAVANTHADVAWRSLERADIAAGVATVHAAEANKSLATVERLYAEMLAARLERTSPVIALGGGIVCDIAGFAAATFQRGVPVIMTPTTLLAMVDAAIGGKNGVNLACDGGAIKNAVGTLWQPRAIVIDPAVLATLPMRHVRSGLAECIKVALLRDEAMLDVIADVPGWVEAGAWGRVSEVIARSAAIKASIVERDEREDASSLAGRAVLNLGHTFAHAIELVPDLDVHHGEAVAIGLVAAAHVARRLGRIDESREMRWREVITSAGLSVQLPHAVPVATLLASMRRDKKVKDSKIRLVLPAAKGGAELVDGVAEADIVAALLAIGAWS